MRGITEPLDVEVSSACTPRMPRFRVHQCFVVGNQKMVFCLRIVGERMDFALSASVPNPTPSALFTGEVID